MIDSTAPRALRKHAAPRQPVAPWVGLCLVLMLSSTGHCAPSIETRIDHVLEGTPLIDGHNDLPWEIRARFKGDLAAVDLMSDTARLPYPKDEAAGNFPRKNS